jgi:Zn-dependent alcohol dehydrogenase
MSAAVLREPGRPVLTETVLLEPPRRGEVLVRAGRLNLADVVSDLIGLDDVQWALDRLRRAEGDRSVVILDAELAGAEPRARR